MAIFAFVMSEFSLQAVKNKFIIFTAIDNLIKGASGQAVQNMNLLFKFNESLGLKK